MQKKIKLTAKQKEAIIAMRSTTYGTTGIHGLLGYDSVFVHNTTMRFLVKNNLADYEGYTMNEKADLYFLTQLGKTIEL